MNKKALKNREHLTFYLIGKNKVKKHKKRQKDIMSEINSIYFS